MSSIYKKGRDGYYYYQTYVLNPDTGKKDKRIFYSLGTKNKLEAQEKKILLDKKHASSKTLVKRESSLTNFGRIIILIILMFPIYFIQHYLNDSSEERDTLKQDSFVSLDSSKIDSVLTSSKFEVNTHINNNLDNVGVNNDSVNVKNLTLEYNIQRFERTSGHFNQGKVFLTIKKNANKESLLYLCEEVAKKYSQFSNIIVCVYLDTDDGRRLAAGDRGNLDKDAFKKLWLAMYTFNDVEGAYFDNNPSQYLGNI